MVSASPDARRSTASLRQAVERLGRDGDAHVEWWFLRDGEDHGADGPVSTAATIRVVDHLRTSPISSVLDRWGAHAIAARVAGLRLRAWWRRAAPDVVVLDDGLGGRVLPNRPPPVVVRVNPTGPTGLATEESYWSGPVAGRWFAPGASDAPGPTEAAYERLELERSAPASPEAVDAARRAAGLPTDEPIVCWPAADGDELTVALGWLVHGDDRFDRPAHVVWLDPQMTSESHARVAAAAAQVGVAERLHQRAAWSGGLARAVDASVAPADRALSVDRVRRAVSSAAGDGVDGDVVEAFDDVVRLIAEVASGGRR